MKKNIIATISFTVILTIIFISGLLPSMALGFDQTARKAFIDSLTRGETFDNDGQTYAWLPTLRGVKTVNTKAAINAAAAAIDETTVEQKGPYTIYGPSSAPLKSATAKAPSVTSAADGSAYPIALNLRTNSLAIITGNIWLKLKNMQETKTIGDEYGLVFSFSNAAMSTSFYSVPADTDIAILRQRLQTDFRILRVTLDMVDRIRRPQ